MKTNHPWLAAIAVACLGLPQFAFSDCVISEALTLLDPVEVGFCESDAVFVGKSEGAIESIGGATPEGSTITKHFRIQHSNVRVIEVFKGSLPEKAALLADLYANDSYAFAAGKTYLIFAKRKGENEYVAAGVCSAQSTLLIGDAKKVLMQLAENRSGRKAIDCNHIRAKEKM